MVLKRSPDTELIFNNYYGIHIYHIMLHLHYVPGNYGSQKRSSPWCFSHFCLCVQVPLSLASFSNGLSRQL